jgi:hypothetical protein
MELVGLPDEPLKVLLDTGASFNVFNTTMFDMVKHLITEPIKSCNVQLRSHTNTLIRVRGRVNIDMKLKSPNMKDKTFHIPFLITEDCNTPRQGRIILGGSFMKQQRLGLVMGFGPNDQSFLSVPRDIFSVDEIEEKIPSLTLLEDIYFGPGELKQVEAQIAYPYPKIGQEVLCHIDVPQLGENIDAIVKVSKRGKTSLMLENRNKSNVFLTEGNIIGQISDEIESIVPAASIFKTMTYLGKTSPIKVDHCFCESDAIIGLLHQKGFTCFPNEHLFSVTGDLVDTNFLTLDMPRKRLFIDSTRQKVRNVDYTKVITQIATLVTR